MDKYIKDDCVAVLTSEWVSTCEFSYDMRTDKELVTYFLEGNEDKFEDTIKEKYNYDPAVCGSTYLGLMSITWVPIGTKFIIEENEMGEYIIELDKTKVYTA